jgi:hypothetical protein
MGGWRKLPNKEAGGLCSWPSIIRMTKLRRMRWVEHVSRMEEKSSAYRLLVGKPWGKRPIGRPRCSWVDNIKMNLGEIELSGVHWIYLVQDRDKLKALVNVVMNLQVP